MDLSRLPGQTDKPRGPRVCLGSASGRWCYSSVLQSPQLSLHAKVKVNGADLTPKGRSRVISSCLITGDC